MQKAKQNYFKDRTVFYATFPIQEQTKKGDWDFKLKAVYCIGILDFTFNSHKENSEVIHTVQLKDQNHQLFYDKLKFIYIEMPRFEKNLEQLESHQDRWLYFIKNLADLQHIPDLFIGDIIYQGFETARIAALDDVEQQVYQASLKEYRDMFSVIKTAKDDSLKEGELKRAMEGAINLLRLKLLTDEQIASTMRLTIEQVAELKKKLDNDK